MFEGLFFDVFGVVLLSEVGKFMAHPSKCLSVGAPHFLASFLYLLLLGKVFGIERTIQLVQTFILLLLAELVLKIPKMVRTRLFLIFCHIFFKVSQHLLCTPVWKIIKYGKNWAKMIKYGKNMSKIETTSNKSLSYQGLMLSKFKLFDPMVALLYFDIMPKF